MAIRKVLLPLQNAATAEAAFSMAVMVAQRWRAHLAVLHVGPVGRSGATDMRAVFERLAAAHNLMVAGAQPNAECATTDFTVLAGREADVVAYQARLADLIVVPHPASDEDASSSDALHAVLFDSAQPVLIAPRVAPILIGTRICVGWNGTAESASAVLAALPWLHRASAIRILWSEEYQRRGPDAVDLATYLASHGLTADQAQFRSIDNIVGAGLLAAANDFPCDLLVMGAYSHSRFRQSILGGVTRHVLGHAGVPLMMHR
jgi:nucleotide-binding universal stress UspA family protein